MTLAAAIDVAFEKRTLGAEDVEAINEVIEQLDAGVLRVCEWKEGTWRTNQWIKKAILLYFRANEIADIESGAFVFRDKVPVKRWRSQDGVRVVPQAIARKGSYVEPGCILMPSFVNIGAYVGAGTMIDTWATVGSCAQVGRDVHLAGGVGIGGVLEPLQASPVIIEDHAFIGSRCVVVEGVRVGKASVLGAGVVLTGSTKIIDVTTSPPTIHRGFVPPNSVVIPGTRAKTFPGGSYGVPCALIIGIRSEITDKKTSLTAALREIEAA